MEKWWILHPSYIWYSNVLGRVKGFFCRRYYTSLLLLIVVCVWFLILICCITFPAVFSILHTVSLLCTLLTATSFGGSCLPALGLEVNHGSHLETSDQLLGVFTWKCNLFFIWSGHVESYMLSTCLDLFIYFSAVSTDSSCRSSVNSLPCSDKLKHTFPRRLRSEGCVWEN